MIQTAKSDSVRDAARIAAAQTVEMCEIGTYGTVLAWAQEMGHGEIAELLEETLDEEEACNKKLTKLAEGGLNESANDMERDDEED